MLDANPALSTTIRIDDAYSDRGLTNLEREDTEAAIEDLNRAIDFGFGDNSMLAPLMKQEFPAVQSDLHWDLLYMRPTLMLNDKIVVENGVIPDKIPSN